MVNRSGWEFALFIFAAVQAVGAILQLFGVKIPLPRWNLTTQPASRFTFWISLATLAVAIWGLTVVLGGDYRTSDWMGNDPRWAMYKKTDVMNGSFSQEVVQVDGRRFINCRFDNVTFLYNATAPWELAGNTVINGHINIRTDNKRLGAFIAFLNATQSFNPGTKVELHP